MQMTYYSASGSRLVPLISWNYSSANKEDKKKKQKCKGLLTAEGIGGNGWDAINVEDCV